MYNPFLIGKKIYLRPLELADASFFCIGENNPLVRETLFLGLPINQDQQEDKLRQWINSRESIVFTIVNKKDDTPVGQTAFFRIDYISRAAIFYLAILDPSCWSHGVGTEATDLMVKYAFKTLNLNRIQLHVYAENKPAIKIYQRIGFVKEGVLRRAMFHNGEYCDFWVMGILQKDVANPD